MKYHLQIVKTKIAIVVIIGKHPNQRETYSRLHLVNLSEGQFGSMHTAGF